MEARDPDPQRRALAARFGADRAVDPAQGDTGVVTDVAIELSGLPAAVSTALDSVDIGGRVVLAGSVAPPGTVPVDPEHLVRSLITIVGVHNCEPRHLAAAVDFLAATARYDFTSVIAEPAGLADLPTELTDPGGRSSGGPSVQAIPPDWLALAGFGPGWRATCPAIRRRDGWMLE